MSWFKLFKSSKKIHKFLGLALMLFIVWISMSGIMMNHPEIISGIAVPKSLVPGHYHLKNWNRGAIANVIFSKNKPNMVFLAGKEGVYRSTDGGVNYQPFMDGEFSSSSYYRKTNTLFLKENNNESFLVAGTYKGLYLYDLNKSYGWKRIPLAKDCEQVMKILEKDGKLLVFSDSYLYSVNPAKLTAKMREIKRFEIKPQISLIRLFFDIHDGKAWGIGGKLIFDAAGFAMVFLCVTGFYMWFFPKRARTYTVIYSKPKFQRLKNLFKTTNKWHLKAGITFALLFLIIGATGFFMRPPTLILIDRTVSSALYPGFLSANPWDRKIRNAEFDSTANEFLIDADDGYWTADGDLNKPFQKKTSPIPIFPMGATVMKSYPEGIMIGSFNGLYFYERETGRIIDAVDGNLARDISVMMPAKHMITGYFETPEGDRFIATHNIGLVRVGESMQRGRFIMPPRMENYSMPLWNYLFELHNGRFFKGIAGGFYILIAPLGSAAFVLLTLTGIYDWIYKKLRKRKRSAEEKEVLEILNV